MKCSNAKMCWGHSRVVCWARIVCMRRHTLSQAATHAWPSSRMFVPHGGRSCTGSWPVHPEPGPSAAQLANAFWVQILSCRTDPQCSQLFYTVVSSSIRLKMCSQRCIKCIPTLLVVIFNGTCTFDKLHIRFSIIVVILDLIFYMLCLINTVTWDHKD